MTIILTGGGSGGHITPVLAVAKQIKVNYPDAQLIYIGQRGDSLSDLPARHPAIDLVFTVRAGKFRRYQGNIIRQMLDIKTLAKNIRDLFFTLIGIFQSYIILRKLRADVVFIRGGFVGVPVGLAAAMRKIPYITHDSDAMPSLANRIVARWATAHAVAMPKHSYPYNQFKTFRVGVPIDQNYQPVTKNLKINYRHKLGIDDKAQVLLVTGGGLGAQRLNNIIIHVVPLLLDSHSELILLHLTGRNNYKEINNHYAHMLGTRLGKRVTVKGFVDDLYLYSGAADVIVCRAGATNLAEFAQQQKACIVVPNPQLTGGHQVENSRQLKKADAITAVDEKEAVNNPNIMLNEINLLLGDSRKRRSLENNIAKFARPEATNALAELIVTTAKNTRTS